MQKDVNLDKYPQELLFRVDASNEYLAVKIGFDTVEHEPRKFWITDLSDNIFRASAGGQQVTRILDMTGPQARVLGSMAEFS